MGCVEKGEKEEVDVYVLLDSPLYFQLTPHTSLVVPAAFNYARDIGLKGCRVQSDERKPSWRSLPRSSTGTIGRSGFLMASIWPSAASTSMKHRLIPPESGEHRYDGGDQSPKRSGARRFLRSGHGSATVSNRSTALRFPSLRKRICRNLYLSDHYFSLTIPSRLFDALILGAKSVDDSRLQLLTRIDQPIKPQQVKR